MKYLTLLAKRPLTLVACFFVFPLSLGAQGHGSVGSNGLVPRIDFEHRQVGNANSIRWQGFTPGRPLILFMAHGENPIALDVAGYGPAILGPDLGAALGSSIMVGNVADAAGEFTLATVVPPALAGVAFHYQAAAIDFGAPHNGVAFSEHRRVMFGSEPDAAVFSLQLPDSSRRLLEIFGDANLAAPASAEFDSLNLRTMSIKNHQQGAFARRDQPGIDEFAGGGPRVRLPGGFSLLLARSVADVESLILIHPDAHLETLAVTTAEESEFMFEASIAASNFDPYVVIASETGLPEYDGSHLLLARVDGWNIPGRSEKAMGIVLPGTGVTDIDIASLTFADGALFFVNGTSELIRFDLATQIVSTVVFPPSAGLTPVYLDNNAAVAGDGSSLAIGAGASATSHDIYQVSAAGLATKVTNSAGDYDKANPGSPNGANIALDEQGQFLAFNRNEPTNETYILSTTPLSPEISVTNQFEFVESIDTVVGVGFRAGGRLVLNAGLETNQLEVYTATPQLAGSNFATIQNMSLSSGVTIPLFGIGSDLTFIRSFSTEQHFVTELVDSTGLKYLVFVSDAGDAIVRTFDSLRGCAGRTSQTMLCCRLTLGTIEIETISETATPAAIQAWSSAGAATVMGQTHHRDRNETILLVNDNNGPQVLLLDATDSFTVLPSPAHEPDGSIWLDRHGDLRVISQDVLAGTTYVERFDRIQGTWEILAGPFTGIGFGVILD